jgi:photosystem II stability/assembly factor-like uncharacterized protein
VTRRARRAPAFASIFALLLAPSGARANGAFPAVSQIVADPVDPQRLFLRSTFGVVLTRDGGANWDWICESAAGYLNIEPPMTVLEGGRVLLALTHGISRSSNGACEFSMAESGDVNMVDVSRATDDPERAVALSTSDLDSTVWESLDAGASWSELTEPFPDLLATTLDIAASDGDVLYVSGVVGAADAGGQGVLLRSDDRGRSWLSFPVPATNSAKKPYIAAVDPRAARTVYVRTTGLPGRLLVTRDGGETFDEVLRLEVPIQGFALAPDGETVLATNVYDGSYRAATDSLVFEKIACRGPSCLLWNELGLFGCGDDLGDGFIVGRSDDAGASFTHLLNLSCVRGPLDCEASTIVGGECPTYWPGVRTQLGAETCTPLSVPPYTGCFAEGGAGGSAGTVEGGAGEGGAPAQGGSGAARAGTTASQAPCPEPEGCGCSTITTKNHWKFSWIVGTLIALARRRATRSRARPTLPSPWV